MKNNLKLITTENFGTVPCNFYRTINDDILLTREQIGQALEYQKPSKAIQKIHLKHQDRLEPLCIKTKLGYPQSGGDLTKSDEQERIYYTERGVMEICRWSRQPKANQFMDWVWDIVEKYRNNELLDMQQILPVLNQINTALSSVTAELSRINAAFTVMNEKVTSLDARVTTLEKTVPQLPQRRRYTYWSTKMFPKYQALMEHFGILKNGDLYKQLYAEFSNLYPDIELNQIVDDYCYENKIDGCYTLDAIERDKTVRNLFEHMVDDLLEKYELVSDEGVSMKKRTIFDDVA